MSDHWIILIPEDPRFVPEADRQRRARDWFAEIAPRAERIEIRRSEKVVFFDCGANLDGIYCPVCRASVTLEWWQTCMDADHEGGFRLAKHPLPCCGTNATLHELNYDWPQGFGCFALEVMNPGIGKLNEKQQQELEAILGTKLRAVYRHL